MEIPDPIIWVGIAIAVWTYILLPLIAFEYDFIRDLIWKRTREPIVERNRTT